MLEIWLLSRLLIQTSEYGNIEFGAQWVHGDQGNPIYREMSQLGLLDYRGEHLYDDEYAGE